MKINAGAGGLPKPRQWFPQPRRSLRERRTRLRMRHKEAKLTYIRLNTQTPCPPRGAVPVNQGRGERFFHPARPVRFRSWMRLPQLCRPGSSQKLATHRKAFRRFHRERPYSSTDRFCEYKSLRNSDEHTTRILLRGPVGLQPGGSIYYRAARFHSGSGFCDDPKQYRQCNGQGV